MQNSKIGFQDAIRTGCGVVAERGAALLNMALTRADATRADASGKDGKAEDQTLYNVERFHLAATIWSILPTELSRATHTECE